MYSLKYFATAPAGKEKYAKEKTFIWKAEYKTLGSLQKTVIPNVYYTHPDRGILKVWGFGEALWGGH